MKERGILFSAPMVRSLLDGSKRQTRRICKPAATLTEVVAVQDPSERGQRPPYYTPGWFGDTDGEVQFFSPYGQPGERLWVRETHRPIFGQTCGLIAVDYRADPREKWERLGDQIDAPTKWIPSIHMRREYSRILLEITGVRVERLQDISDADAVAEGIRRIGEGFERWHPDPADTEYTGTTKDPVLGYRGLWEFINGAGSWDANPWVWVVTFKRLESK